jgi:DNA repair protein RadC
MSIQHWPEAERPRERLLAQGPAALSDAELIAILLRQGTRGVDAVSLARRLLQSSGGIHSLLVQSSVWFTAQPGLGQASYAQLQAACELGRRFLTPPSRLSTPITHPHTTREILRGWLTGYEREAFACLFLDNRHRLISREVLFLGTLNAATVHPREIVKRALSYNAAAVILAHNHPSGIAEPSAADRAITREIANALTLIEVRLLDHFVVGDDIISFAERGLL